MKSITRTQSQARWASMSTIHQKAIAAIRRIESHGHEVQRALPARIAAEADRVAAEQPRTARVSRADIEAHVNEQLRTQLLDELRPAARSARVQFEQDFEALKAQHAKHKRAARQPRRPDGDVSEAERLGLSSLAEQRATRAELRELNARLELATYSADELLAVAADPDADPARRYVAEGLAGRALSQKPAHPEPTGPLTEDQLLKHQKAIRAIDEKHTADLARLAGIRDVRLPAEVRAREAATDSLIATIEQRWHRLRGPFEIAEKQGVPMIEPHQTDIEQAEEIDDASRALIAAVEAETLAEARAE